MSNVRHANAGSAVQSASEAVDQGLEYFPRVETHLIPSVRVQQTFKIQVVQPPRRRGEIQQRLPVVYATDGNAVFDMLKGISSLMHAAKVESRPFILVTIGYPGDSPMAGEVLRGRDFTFPGCPDFCKGVRWNWEGLLWPEKGAKDFGGAQEFQRFIGDELIPLIDSHYATVPGDRTYFGHSAGGGFGLFTLLSETQLFRNYIISSPILTYDGEMADGTRYEHHDFMFERLKNFLAAGKSLDGIRLYLAAGSEEEFRPIIANWHFTSSLYRMEALIREAAIPGLALTSEVFQGETHITAWPLAFMRGIRAIFGTKAESR